MLTSGIFVFIFGEPLACHWPQVALDGLVQNVSQIGFLFQLLAKVGCMKCKGKFAQKLKNCVPWLHISNQKCQLPLLNLSSDFFIGSVAWETFPGVPLDTLLYFNHCNF